jgi:DNA segregation ATPase FtsK/SpoIIIE-like protein
MAKFLIIRKPIYRDVIGLFMLALSVFLAISLLSFHHSDLSGGAGEPGGNIFNWGGIVGAWLASLLFTYLGIVAFAVPPACLVWSVHFFKKEGIRYLGYDLVCGAFIALAALSILGLIFANGPVLYSDTVHPGGVIGIGLARLFTGLFNTAGAAVFSSLALVLFLVLLFGISPVTAVGTDLLYAAITKTVGVGVHQRNRTVDWRIAGRLAMGSLPAAALALWLAACAT